MNDPTPYYRSVDLFLLSLDCEGLGNVIVEALACGLPVVSTDCSGGSAEILLGGAYGRPVPVGDKASLAHATVSALPEPYEEVALTWRAAEFAVRDCREIS